MVGGGITTTLPLSPRGITVPTVPARELMTVTELLFRYSTHPNARANDNDSTHTNARANDNDSTHTNARANDSDSTHNSPRANDSDSTSLP